MQQKRRYPPGPTSSFSLRVYLDLFRNPLSFIAKIAGQYGDITYMRFGSRHDYLINHPDLIQKVILSPEIFARSTSRVLRKTLGKGILTAEMDTHSQQKRYLQPAFHKDITAEYASTMGTITQALSQKWENAEPEYLDIAEEMNHLALEIVVKTLLGSEMNTQENEIVQALEMIKNLTDQKKSAFIDPLLSKLPLPRSIAYQKARQCLDKKIFEIINEKRSGDLKGNDLVTVLLRDQGSAQGCPFLNDSLVRDEVMTMFTAGHETIASAMTWTWYLLGQNPEVEKKLHEELDTVLGLNPPVADDLNKLIYTKKVFLESMRVYPPVWLIVRHPTQDVELGGYTIPAGAYVHLCQYTLHHDPRYFPNPEIFDPERWTLEKIAARPKFSYFPFGGGKRQCIGEGFAMAEGLMVIATLAQKWRMRRVSQEPIELEPYITLRPKNGMHMTLQKRVSGLKDQYEFTTAGK